MLQIPNYQIPNCRKDCFCSDCDNDSIHYPLPTSLSLILTKDRRDDFWPEDEKTKNGNVCKKNMLI